MQEYCLNARRPRDFLSRSHYLFHLEVCHLGEMQFPK